MSDDTRPMTKEDIVDLLIAHGHIRQEDRERILNGVVSSETEQAEYQKSPFWKMLKSRTDLENLDWSSDAVPKKYTR